MLGLKIFFCYKTVYNPSKQMYFGIHETTDMSFGDEGWTDPFVGSGPRIRALVDAGAQRKDFTVSKLAMGSYEQCKAFYDRIVFDYDHPLCLNTKQGAPAGVPKTPEHKAAISESLAVSMEGNTNAVGTVRAVEPVHGGKIKWFNDGEAQLKLETVDGNTPVDPAYKGWELGQLSKEAKAKVQRATVSSADITG